MSGGHGGGTSQALKDLAIILLVFIAIFAIWYATGGPERIKKDGASPFMNPVEIQNYGPIQLDDGFVKPNN